MSLHMLFTSYWISEVDLGKEHLGYKIVPC